MEERLEESGDGVEDGSKDRISTLPEPILHHILSFLYQKEAIKTSVLSKPWRYVGSSCPKIHFYFRPENTEASLSVLDRTLHRYRNHPELSLQELTVSKLDCCNATSSLLEKWIPMLVHSLTSLDLNFYSTSAHSAIFEPPSVVFQSETLRSLSLRGCVLLKSMQPERVHLKHLQNLCLADVYVSEQALDRMLSNCPSIERVSLSSCAGFDRFKPANLKHFRYNSGYHRYVSIEMDRDDRTPRTVEVTNCFFSAHRDLLFGACHLRRLSLYSVQLSSDTFSCSLPCLEELTLDNCYPIREFILLSSPSMKRLAITHNRPHMIKATIDAPNIVSFCYGGVLPKSISFAATSSNGWKSNINLTYIVPPTHKDALSNLNELNGLLKALSRSEIYLQLDEFTIYWLWKLLQIEEESTLDNNSTNIIGGSDAKLPLVVEHLIFKDSPGSFASTDRPAYDYLNRIFHLFRPRFMHFNLRVLPTKLYQIVDILFNFKEREVVQSCFFWQHVLEGVSMQAVLYSDGIECRRHYTSLSEFSENEVELRNPCFQLRWRGMS